MTTAALLLAAGGATRFHGDRSKLVTAFRGRPLFEWSLLAASGAGCDEVVVVDGACDLSKWVGSSVSLLHNRSWASGQATSLRVGIAWCSDQGHDEVLVGLGDQPLIPASAWRSVRVAPPSPVAVATYGQRRGHPVRLSRQLWPMLPIDGDRGARDLMRDHPELVLEVPCEGAAADIDTLADLASWTPVNTDRREG